MSLESITGVVLLIEEEKDLAQEYITELIKAGMTVHCLSFASDLESILMDCEDLRVVVTGFQLDDVVSTFMIERVRQKFNGDVGVIANCSSREENDFLKAAGCEIRPSNGRFSPAELPTIVKGLIIMKYLANQSGSIRTHYHLLQEEDS